MNENDKLDKLADTTEKKVLGLLNKSDEILSDKIKKMDEEIEDAINQN